MSLLDIATDIKNSGFNARKDSVNEGSQNLPEGDYTVILSDAQARISDSGWESINYCFEVEAPGSDFNGRTQWVMMGTLDTWRKKDGTTMDLTRNVKTTLKFFEKALTFADDQMRKSDLEDCKTLEDGLKRKAVGTYYILHVTEFKRRNGETGYNYDLSEAEQVTTPGVEISDEDLPF